MGEKYFRCTGNRTPTVPVVVESCTPSGKTSPLIFAFLRKLTLQIHRFIEYHCKIVLLVFVILRDANISKPGTWTSTTIIFVAKEITRVEFLANITRYRENLFKFSVMHVSFYIHQTFFTDTDYFIRFVTTFREYISRMTRGINLRPSDIRI